jgi:pimeloyl-ACP methyl ester carboxylesterase
MTDSTPYPRRFAAVLAVAALAATAVAAPAAAAPAAAPLSWAPCTESTLPGVECATYRVPLDHDRPRGATTTIALTRRLAADQANKIGTIFANPGGPGGAGRRMAVVAPQFLAPEVLARFDVVGFDPRGVGASDPLQCWATDEQADALLSQTRGVPLTRAEISSTLRAYYAYTEGCKDNAGPLLKHMSTLNVVKDLDLLRRAVGDDKLSFVGYSYGTLIGATYANVFPGRVRALVLDGNVDPDQRTNHRLANKLGRAGGFEIALAGFLRECDAAGPNCAFAGNARAKFDAIVARFRQGPVELPGNGTVTIDDLIGSVGQSLYNMASFPEMGEVLQFVHEVLTGDAPATLAAADVPKIDKAPPGPLLAADAYTFNGYDTLLAVNCADAPLPRNPALYPAIAEAFEAKHPTFGRAEAFSEVGCANWPRIEERYNGPWNARTARTVLVVNPTYDPATRYDFAVRMTRQLGNARLLTLDGFGHTTRYSSCITGWYTRYLLAGELPPAGTRCTQDVPPFPAA